MERGLSWGGVMAVAGLAAWQAAPAIENAMAPAPVATPAVVPAKPVAAAPQAAPAPPLTKNMTPMAERVATIGLLNKRNGLWQDIVMKPGEARRVGDVVVRLKACETTAPWEQDKLTGAFVQLIVLGSDEKWRKVFSGWLFKESPSLNVVEHPIYDVWTKACTMRFPDTGPDTLVVHGGDSDSGAKSSRAKKSAAPEPDDSAADSNPT
jgi:hypothetical protein